ncbi:hypothetical protein SERLADRAFT_404528 [Serpula lacrymans var. lacrymans S7.9]|uniref:DEAD/DEAH-box helicase domain-containing protein n=1 Tax=Serpula lacrymans var. lacrymans (strain S7.9) TaxID=578457 RepID=F8NDE4_SERL9|nr:uncharacterized protein SERLADRAFT_404528 [Serpula lacrymans var. lacrymans S7.9]EGO30282.1 hypothetical protein SERLADRAFT_404528 [Serpula lacrymans var. lacrymans S7.9]
MPTPVGTSKPFQFNTPIGHALARKILAKTLPFEPHDYQIEGVCQCLDGKDLLAIVLTGGGKTTYFYIPPKYVPANPAMVIVSPTNGLEEEMYTSQELELKKYNLKALAINSHTLHQARVARQENLWLTACKYSSMILLSPEQLTSPSIEDMLNNKSFRLRISAIGIDEIHLLDTWGVGIVKVKAWALSDNIVQLSVVQGLVAQLVRALPYIGRGPGFNPRLVQFAFLYSLSPLWIITWGNGFRNAFQKIGYVAAQMPSSVVEIVVTATLTAGPATK